MTNYFVFKHFVFLAPARPGWVVRQNCFNKTKANNFTQRGEDAKLAQRKTSREALAGKDAYGMTGRSEVASTQVASAPNLTLLAN
ncbi:MAG: hypothetical protein ONB44_03575 [candidate division KSB1 bacterium]|nr:hypothetical protein [candidate division KSB1 bacterium]MDZ7301208.1 hypothetical protein [candidate division KSB1 bacterium]MDZ7310568.1 hypothetical protein [candidate division KSB1 bacterium]